MTRDEIIKHLEGIARSGEGFASEEDIKEICRLSALALSRSEEAERLLRRVYNEMCRWKSCQTIVVCRQCVDDGISLALKTHLIEAQK